MQGSGAGPGGKRPASYIVRCGRRGLAGSNPGPVAANNQEGGARRGRARRCGHGGAWRGEGGGARGE
jgi:hypothetical protein